MRTTTAAMDTHLAQPTTNLVLLIKLTRKDGQVFGFTNHDRPLTIGGVDYAPGTGFLQASATEASDNLSVDNTEAEFVLDTAAITEQDIRNGAWRNAPAELYVAVWTDDTITPIRLPGDSLGEIVLEEHQFKTELRGLGEYLRHPIIEDTSVICRADFADARCGLLESDHSYQVRVATVDPDRRKFTVEKYISIETISEALTNPGFESSIDWSSSPPWVPNGFTYRTAAESVFPRSGTYCASGGGGTYGVPDHYVYQDVDLANIGVDPIALSLGTVHGSASFWINTVRTFNETLFELYYLDSLLAELGKDQLPKFIPPKNTWTQHTLAFPSVPAGTEYIRVKCWAIRQEQYVEQRLDDFTLSLVYPDYSPVTPDPIPELDVANQFTDGTLRWLTGGNTGATMEISSYDSSTYEVTLYEGMAFDVAVGDELVLIDSCNGTLAECQAYDNVVNRRAEDYRPGNRVLTYPDAQT